MPSVERKILLSVLLLLVLGAGIVLAPFWPWFVLALWTASLARPAVERLTRVIRGRRSAAGLVTVALLIVLTVPLAAAIATAANDAVDLAQRALRSPSGRAALVQLVSGGDGADPDGQAPGSLDLKTAFMLLETHGQKAWSALTTLVGALGTLALGVFAYFAATYAAMVHGQRAYAWVEAQLPITPARLRRLVAAFYETGRGLLISVGLTGLLQATLSTIAYAILDVPRAMALGFATFLASLIPSIGTALVWFPVSLGLLFAGQNGKALAMFVVGTVIIAPSDNLLRPLIARWGRLNLHPFLVLFSMLGGVLTIGAFGLLLGPLVLRLALEAVVLVRDMQRGEASTS